MLLQTSASVTQRQPKVKIISYWILTAFICFELVYGALWDLNILNKGYVFDVLDHLGYPRYLATILAICKLVAAIIILVPGMRLMKEWAYAGVVIMFFAASISHVITGDGAEVYVWSFLFGVLTLGSYFLRPADRRVGAKNTSNN